MLSWCFFFISDWLAGIFRQLHSRRSSFSTQREARNSAKGTRHTSSTLLVRQTGFVSILWIDFMAGIFILEQHNLFIWKCFGSISWIYAATNYESAQRMIKTAVVEEIFFVLFWINSIIPYHTFNIHNIISSKHCRIAKYTYIIIRLIRIDIAFRILYRFPFSFAWI